MVFYNLFAEQPVDRNVYVLLSRFLPMSLLSTRAVLVAPSIPPSLTSLPPSFPAVFTTRGVNALSLYRAPILHCSTDVRTRVRSPPHIHNALSHPVSSRVQHHSAPRDMHCTFLRLSPPKVRATCCMRAVVPLCGPHVPFLANPLGLI